MKKLLKITMLILAGVLIAQNCTLKTKEVKAPMVSAPVVKYIRVANKTDQDIYIAAEAACQKHQLAEECINDVRAIAAAETAGTFNCQKVGDDGSAHGCFQINFYWPRTITPEQAVEIKTSVNWTLDRLIATGYKTNRDRAIMKHNGTPNTKKTLTYLNNVNRYKADMTN